MKKNFLVLGLLFFGFQLFGQTMYVKLKKPIEDSRQLIDKVNQQFSASFTKSEKTSKLLNAHIYKVNHSLNKSETKRLHAFIKEEQDVVYSSLMFEPVSPPNDIPPTTQSFVVDQEYLEKDPGVNAKYAWSNGADGSNVTVHVVEYGLNIDHEEFVGRNAKIADGMTVSSEATSFITEHGTATAGVVFSHDGGYGTKGIAYNADEYILYPEWQEGQIWDRVQAVSNAVTNANRGDIIIYEMQFPGPDDKYVVAEIDPLVWDLTKIATDNGIVVVAAAGNGHGNLDSPDYDEYNSRGDSGAIIVGASMPDTLHETYSFSTFGSRVNINAWGSDVFTTGYGYIQIGPDNDINQYYMSSYSGTSSATAISGGCVTALQSFYYTISGGQYLTSVEMRDILVQSGIQLADTTPVGSYIDMEAAMEMMTTLLSSSDENFENQVIVYPNPTSDFIKIRQLQNTELKKVDVFNSLGKLILSKETNGEEFKLDLTVISQGVYFLRITSGNKIAFKRIIKR
jgi:hypothetical protein